MVRRTINSSGFSGLSTNQKGQVTIFVVLGIILLVIGGIFFVVKDMSFNVDQGLSPEVEQEFGHIKKFVDTCVYKVSKEAISKLGEHGGYINPSDYGIVPVPGFPTKSSGFEFTEGSGYVIPYWYYMSSSDSCIYGCNFNSKRPSLSGSAGSIESQISSYVKNNLNGCLNDFKIFKEQGYDVEVLSDMNVETVIGETSVIVNLDYDLGLSKDDKSAEISSYSAILDVRLKQIYEVATGIVNFVSDREIFPIESMTKEIIALKSMGPSPQIPPVGGFPELNPTSHPFWLLDDVKEVLQYELMNNIPTMQVMFARNSAFFASEDPYIDVTFNNRMILLNPGYYEPSIVNKFNINFVYLGWWPIYLKVKPGGQVITPTFIGIDVFQFFNLGMDLYNFAYDVSYPVMIILEDEDAFNGEGFTFQLGVETNLRNSDVILDAAPFEIPTVEEGTNVSVPFCNFDQRSSGDITIRTFETITHEPVDNVYISYNCFDDACYIPNTRINNNGLSQITTNLPSCLGGYFTASKRGYSSVRVPYSTNFGVGGLVELQLTKEKPFNISIKKHPLQKLLGDWNLAEASSSLDESDTLLLIFEKIVGENEEDYSQFITIDGYEDQTINLIPGNYTVQGTLLRNLGEGHDPEEITIPESEIEGETIPEMSFNTSFLLGGIEFDAEHPWEFNVSNYNASKIEFHVVGIDIPSISSFDDLQQMGAYTEYSVSKRNILEPVFIE